jgi:hypothetical protein
MEAEQRADHHTHQTGTVSDTPVRYVVIGDVHQDKGGNTGLFVAAGAEVITHENEKKGLETHTKPAGHRGRPAFPMPRTTPSGWTTGNARISRRLSNGNRR